MNYTEQTNKYFADLGEEINKNYEIAEKARAMGLDPVDKVEVPLALTMASKVVKLIATKYPQLDDENIINRILDLEKQYGALDNSVSFTIAREIAQEKYCKFKTQLEAIDAAIRVGFAYNTLGVVSSPIEGFTEVRTGKTQTGETYLKAFFSGPIRSAGTTAACVVIILIDYLRQLFGYARYDPTEKECKRVVTELYDFHERVSNLQYLPTEDEAYFIAKNCPIQIAGEPTEKKEVLNYKNLPRVESDFIRGGFCLILGEGIAQKAAKGLRVLKNLQKNNFKINDWEWLGEYVKLHEKRNLGETDASPTYIKDLVAGRPVFGHPGKGFRFRYGRSRVAGFSAVSVHPATMAVTNDFLATGTQLKIEKPTKGCVVTLCDKIDGPIVKFKNQSVKKMSDYEETKLLYNEIEEIIYLGDILFPLGDVINRNSLLITPGYVEEWWGLELEKAGGKIEDFYNINLGEAIEISKEYQIPLHPLYIYYWTQITWEEFLGFIDWFQHSRINNGKLLFPYNKTEKIRFQTGKRALELLGVAHEVGVENVILDKTETMALLINLGFDKDYDKELQVDFDFKNYNEKNVLNCINKLSKFKIKDKAGEFIGSRMGRPEKSKLRKLTGSPSVLFPVGEEGGRLRSANEALKTGFVKAEFPFNYCNKCNRETIYRVCEICNERTEKKFYCKTCKSNINTPECEEHKIGCRYKFCKIDMQHYFEKARERLNYLKTDTPVLIKGVRGTSSEAHDIENFVKGILRAKYNLCVNKDGTIRYDMTELPLTHFKPKEIEVGIDKLKGLGYVKDHYGKELVNEEQILELKPHDIIVPCNNLAGDEKADEVFMNVAKFIDELLIKFYNLPAFYNIEKRSDLIGKLCVCMAPHNCAGVIGRIIGFSKVQGLFASPYMHAAMRRDCFDYNTYISIKQNGNWKNIKIGELVEKLNPEKIVDNYGTKEKEVKGFETIGFDGKKLIKVRINNFTKHTKIPMLEIKTELGKKIKVTENHKFFVDGKKKRASDLKVGDRLPLPKKIDIKSNDLKEINLLERLKEEKVMVRGIKKIINQMERDKKNKILRKLKITKKQFQNFHIRDSYPAKFVLELGSNLKNKIYEVGKIATKRDNVETPIIIKLTNELLEVIGLYVAEGYSRSIKGKKGLNQVYISGFDEKLMSFVKQTIKKSFGLKPTERKNDRAVFSSKILYWFFTKILETGSIAQDKRIPYLFLDLKLEKLACFLRGYFEGDGSVSLRDIRVTCDSVSEGLLSDLEFCLARFGIFAKRYKYEKEPGPKIRGFYIKKKRSIPKFKITKLIIGSDFVQNFMKIGFLSKRKNDILNSYKNRNPYGMEIIQDDNFIYDSIISINGVGEKESYCLNVDPENHLVVANNIINFNCDGDESAVMLLLDVLINFSRKFLPAHRGGTQDAPLVLNGQINAKEVDDQILDFELVEKYPLELYEKAEQKLHSGEVHIEMVKQRIGRGEDPFINTGFTHSTENFNLGATCSNYKTLPTMQEKVKAQMELCSKLRSVDQGDVARLIIDRHFIRDLKGNLRKFSQQNFRCGKCNEIYRRPPLNGKCEKCGNPKLIFTIAYGSIIKYLEPALDLTRNYKVPVYISQDLELTKKYIESIFGRESEKQESMGKWF